MKTRPIVLALGVGMTSLAAQAQLLTTLDDSGQPVGGNGVSGIPGTAGAPQNLSPADLAAFSGPGVSRNSGTRTGGITGIVDGKGFAGGATTGTGASAGSACEGAGSPPPPVPEPETYAMLIAGLGMLSAFARHKKYP